MHRFIDLAVDFQAADVHPKRKTKRKLYKPSYPVILHQRNKSLLSKLWKVEKSLILESKIRDFCRNLPKKSLLFWIWTVYVWTMLLFLLPDENPNQPENSPVKATFNDF